MRRYDTIVVISGDLPDTKVKEEVTRIQSFLESHSASEVKVDKWGTKEVSRYQRRIVNGHYFCFNYKATDHSIQDVLCNMLRISDGVLKFQNFRINEKVRKFKGYVRKNQASSGDSSDDIGDVETASY